MERRKIWMPCVEAKCMGLGIYFSHTILLRCFLLYFSLAFSLLPYLLGLGLSFPTIFSKNKCKYNILYILYINNISCIIFVNDYVVYIHC